MSGFIQGEDRSQATLFPERLDDYVAEDSSVRVIDVFLDDLDLSGLEFKFAAIRGIKRSERLFNTQGFSRIGRLFVLYSLNPL